MLAKLAQVVIRIQQSQQRGATHVGYNKASSELPTAAIWYQLTEQPVISEYSWNTLLEIG